MHITLAGPAPHLLPPHIKHDPERTPQKDQTHVQHDRRHEPALLDPRRDELGEPIPPHILVDRDRDHDRASDRLIAVHGVRRGNSRDGGDLDAGTREADQHDRLPRPLVLHAEGDDEVAQQHDQHVGHERGQTHLGLADAAVAARQARREPVG